MSPLALGFVSFVIGIVLLIVIFLVIFGMTELQKKADPGKLEVAIGVGVYAIATLIVSIFGLTWWVILIGSVVTAIAIMIFAAATDHPLSN